MNMLKILITGCTLTLTSITFAQVNNKPCMNIAAACENAGFRISGPTGKSIWPDCVKPILAGQTVAGVSANPADVQACKEKKAQHKMQRMQNSQPATAPSTVPANPPPAITY